MLAKSAMSYGHQPACLTPRRFVVEAAAIVACAALIPPVMMRGLDELEAAKVARAGIPTGNDKRLWRYRDRIVIMSRRKKAAPLLRSNTWVRLLEEIEQL